MKNAITVVTPFQRLENLELLSNVLKDKCHWILLIDDYETYGKVITNGHFFGQAIYMPKPPEEVCPSNWLFNKFIDMGLEDETQYVILCDDDSVEEGFFDKIPDEDVVICSMKRGQRVPANGVGYGYGDLIASPDNIGIGKVAGEQMILKGKVLSKYRYGLTGIGDGEMVMEVVNNEPLVVFVPDAHVLFNYFEDGRYDSFRRKSLILFIGDYYCAGNPAMGKSEWEGNLAHSLDSTGLADVLCFHMDKYFLTTGKRGDEALLERIEEIKPDYTVLIIYKEPSSDPTVASAETISKLPNLITIWGDLEAEEQRFLALKIAPFCKKVIGTANKTTVEGMGYTYLHVPKDPRVFNNLNRERDIDVIFYGSHGYGREERREALQYLIDNGVRLMVGGSEGGDHFSTEDYADGYKCAKIAISFSQARGMNVVNARPFEVMSCGAMLLEQKSEELAKLYTEGMDYAAWVDKVDLLERIKYYLEHEDERTLIASNGQRKTERLYSAKTFWEEALR